MELRKNKNGVDCIKVEHVDTHCIMWVLKEFYDGNTALFIISDKPSPDDAEVETVEDKIEDIMEDVEEVLATVKKRARKAPQVKKTS